jgi:hypothetical protein
MDAAEPGGVVSLRALVDPVKTSWAPTVTAPKKDALRVMLATCGRA